MIVFPYKYLDKTLYYIVKYSIFSILTIIAAHTPANGLSFSQEASEFFLDLAYDIRRAPTLTSFSEFAYFSGHPERDDSASEIMETDDEIFVSFPVWPGDVEIRMIGGQTATSQYIVFTEMHALFSGLAPQIIPQSANRIIVVTLTPLDDAISTYSLLEEASRLLGIDRSQAGGILALTTRIEDSSLCESVTYIVDNTIRGAVLVYREGDDPAILDCVALKTYNIIGLSTAFYPNSLNYTQLRVVYDLYARMAIDFASFVREHHGDAALSRHQVNEMFLQMILHGQ